MANLILPNGQTIQTDNPAEIAEFMSRGAQSQDSALAAYAQTGQVGSSAPTIQQIASERGQAWNSQGGQGYLDAMKQGPAAGLAAKGRDGDTLVAHINDREAAVLKAMGGRGSVHPETGLLEFAETNFARNDYLANQLGIDRSVFDGSGGFTRYAAANDISQNQVDSLIRGFEQNFNPVTGEALREEASGMYNGSAITPHNIYDSAGSQIGTYQGGGLLTNPTGGDGLLGGGGGYNGGGGQGGGFGGGMPSPTIPTFSNVGNVAGQQGQGLGQMPAPTIGAFGQTQGQPQGQPQGDQQSFEDILRKYKLNSLPLQNGTGFNWMAPNVTPGAVNVMDANYSRRYL